VALPAIKLSRLQATGSGLSKLCTIQASLVRGHGFSLGMFLGTLGHYPQRLCYGQTCSARLWLGTGAMVTRQNRFAYKALLSVYLGIRPLVEHLARNAKRVVGKALTMLHLRQYSPRHVLNFASDTSWDGIACFIDS
jgi:hypothetical protein